MFCMIKKKKIYPSYLSKHNSNREKQVILLMIPNGEQSHYLAVKQLSALLRGITSTDYGNFYYLHCFHSFRIKANLNRMKEYLEIKIFVRL